MAMLVHYKHCINWFTHTFLGIPVAGTGEGSVDETRLKNKLTIILFLLFPEAFHSLYNGRILFNFWLFCAERIIGDGENGEWAHHFNWKFSGWIKRALGCCAVTVDLWLLIHCDIMAGFNSGKRENLITIFFFLCLTGMKTSSLADSVHKKYIDLFATN